MAYNEVANTAPNGYGQLTDRWNMNWSDFQLFSIYDGNPDGIPESLPYTNPQLIADDNASVPNLSPCDTMVYPPGSYDYHLAPNSPFIDEGDPLAGADCADGTPADIGSYGDQMGVGNN